jgi:hypothetical protein
MVDQKSIGSRAQVMHGNARKTSGGLTKKQLKYNKQGKIVSRKASALARKNNRLVKAGYKTQKGVFGNGEMRGGGINDYMRVINLETVESIVNTFNGANVTYCYVLKPSLLTGFSSTKCGPSMDGVMGISKAMGISMGKLTNRYADKVDIGIKHINILQDDFKLNTCEIWCYTAGETACHIKIHKYLFKNGSSTIKVELKNT